MEVIGGPMGLSLNDRKVCYNMKFDRCLLTSCENDDDLVNMLQGNDDHTYLYIIGME